MAERISDLRRLERQGRVGRLADGCSPGRDHPLEDTGDIIGSCSFKGPPKEGMVEIAYGVSPEVEGQGYATEAAQALTDFARASKDVRIIRAHTLPTGRASQRVLAKCGYQHVGEVIDPDDGLVWRFEWAPRSRT